MNNPNVHAGEETRTREIAELCQSIYEAIRCILYALNPYHSMDRSRIQQAIQTRKTIHQRIIEMGKQAQSLEGAVLALAARDPEADRRDKVLLKEYYSVLDAVYKVYSDIYSEGAGEKLEWSWIDDDSKMRSSLDLLENYDKASSSYTFSRAILHQAILDNQCERASSVPEDMIPCAIVVVGGFSPAALQCTQALQGRFGDLVQVDPEQIALQLPECQRALHNARPSLDEVQGLRSSVKHCEDEIAHLLQLLLERGTRNRFNLLISGAGEDAQALASLVRKLREEQYRVSILYFDGNVDKSADRMQRHTVKTGFGLLPEELKRRTALLESNLEAVSKLSPVFLLYNNNGETPKLVWMREGKKSKALDPGYIEERGWTFLKE